MTEILIVTKNWLGDILFEFPAITSIANSFSGASITCLAPKRCHALLLSHPAVKEVINYDEKNEHRPFWKRFGVLRQIRARSWDYGFLFHRSRSRAALLFFGGVKNRIGYRSNRAFFLTHAVTEPRESLHHVDYFLHMLRASGIVRQTVSRYELGVKPETWELVAAQLKKDQVEDYICFHLGANWEPKRWPVSSFVDLAERISEKKSLPIILTGSKADQELGVKFLSQVKNARCFSFIGLTSVEELAALFQKARCVVSADSGPMHVASAVGANVVALFGPTDPRLTGPRGIGKSRILSYVPEGYKSPWYGKDFPPDGWMSKIQPQTVLEAIEREGWLDMPQEGKQP